MRYNTIGSLGAGYGGLSVNAINIGPGVFLAWRDRDTLLANAPGPDGIYRLYQYNQKRGWAQELVDARGATLAAGGNSAGDYVATLQSQPLQTYGNVRGTDVPDWAKVCTVLDGSNDGRFIFASADYLSLGVWAADGSVKWWPVGPHIILGSVRLIDGGFVYFDQSLSHALMLQEGDAAPRPVNLLDAPYDPTSFIFNGERWFFYHNNVTYLHKEGASKGYKFASSYNPDVYIGINQLCHVALTPSAGELASTIQFPTPFYLGESMVDLVDPYVIPKIGPFNHKLHMAMYFPDRDAPGTSCILGNQQDYRKDAPEGCKLILAPTALAVSGPPPRGRFQGIYNETRTGLTMDLAKQHGVPLFVCCDGPGQFPLSFLAQMRSAIDWALDEWYLLPGETIAQAVKRWLANVAWLKKNWKGKIGITWQDYTQAWTVPIQRLLDAHEQLTGLINGEALIEFIGCFAWHRSDACVGEPWPGPDNISYMPSPELAECARRIAAASPGVPNDPTPPIPVPPTSHYSLARRCYYLKETEMKRFVNRSMLRKIDDTHVALQLMNPIDADYAGLEDLPMGTRFPSDDGNGKPLPDGLQTASVFPGDGSVSGRSLTTNNAWETARIDNGFIRWDADGKTHAIPFLE